MKATLTRREAGLFLAGASFAAAQNPQAPHAAAPPSQDPAEEAAQLHSEAAAQLAKFRLPLTAEPVFEFRP